MVKNTLKSRTRFCIKKTKILTNLKMFFYAIEFTWKRGILEICLFFSIDVNI